MNAPTDSRQWKVFSEHKRIENERSRCLEEAKSANTIYLPLIGSTFKQIDEECARFQMNAAMTLLNKCVYVLRGSTNTTSVFGGLVLVECVGRSDDRDVCVYLGGPLMNEKGVIYEDLIVRVAVHAHTYISFR